ncbi:hypothetical protein GCM10027400_18870 [Pseudoxanthomonas daejeonensis]
MLPITSRRRQPIPRGEVAGRVADSRPWRRLWPGIGIGDSAEGSHTVPAALDATPVGALIAALFG